MKSQSSGRHPGPGTTGTSAVRFTGCAGMDIGRDNGVPVDRSYADKSPFAFTGTVKRSSSTSTRTSAATTSSNCTSTSPWPALGAAAAVTQTLELGTYVSQAGVREPMHVAVDAATLDILAPGRVRLGIGAGHTPREWADVGRDRPGPRERAERLAEFAEAVTALLRGETVTTDGRYLTLRSSRLGGLPDGGRVRLVVGGGHPLVLRAAARYADVVGLSGLGRTLPDGYRHEVRWSQAELHRQLQLVRDESQQVGRTPVIEALVQVVRLTGDRAAAAAEIAAQITGATAGEVARPPFLLIGSHEEMATQLVRQGEELGITSYVAMPAAVPVLEQVIALINRK